MKAVKSVGQLVMEGGEQEKAGRLEEAAMLYEQSVQADAGNENAVNRLMMVYRRLKDYKKELAVINNALAFIAREDKIAQEKWLAAHPGVAKLSRQVLQKLGGKEVTAFGTSSFVEKLQKRKAFVEKRVSGTKTRLKAGKGKPSAVVKKSPSAKRSGEMKALAEGKKSVRKGGRVVALPGSGKLNKGANSKAESVRKEKGIAKQKRKVAGGKGNSLTARKEKRQVAEDTKRREVEGRRVLADERRHAGEAKKVAEEAKRKQLAEAKQAEKEAKRRKKEEREMPSLFVVLLQYLGSADRIAAITEEHRHFLRQHFEKGDFLVGGPQAPAMGEVIVARGKNRTAVERLISKAPLFKKKLAKMDVVEFRMFWGKIGEGKEIKDADGDSSGIIM